jgi:hypothetical protein
MPVGILLHVVRAGHDAPACAFLVIIRHLEAVEQGECDPEGNVDRTLARLEADEAAGSTIRLVRVARGP